MFYDRQVKYLDDLINGERRGNAGFVKLEVRDKRCNIHICLNVPGVKGTCVWKCYLADRNKEVEFCSVETMEGKGVKQFSGLEAENIGGTGIGYGDLVAMRFSIGSERELCATWEIIGAELELETGVISVESESPRIETEAAQIKDVALEMPIEKVEKRTFPEEKQPKDMHQEEKSQEEKILETTAMPLQDSKWKQLWVIYPHISPFRDEREFLSVGPGDFVILPEKYFRMVNNSFLLHGYYNYKHLILKRVEQKGGPGYYIGVPGNFYDREKQVAVMFGFESFESMEEQAEVGDFGYYLMRIEL